jgi:hypothetical protein
MERLAEIISDFFNSIDPKPIPETALNLALPEHPSGLIHPFAQDLSFLPRR